MKKHILKLAALSMSLMLFSSPLIACGKKEQETVSYETWWTSSDTESSAEESTQPTSAPSTAASSETSETTPENIAINPFTGLYEMDKANVGKRGIGITINNCKVANAEIW